MTVVALTEPAVALSIFALALTAGSTNLGEIVTRTLAEPGRVLGPAHVLGFAALFIVTIAETGRLPVDNPSTHLELTMIHEAMILEYSGPYLALVEWASALKELLYLTLLADLFLPLGIATTVAPGPMLIAFVAWCAKILVLAVGVTLVESTNAKLRLFRVPELVAVSLSFGFMALAIRFL